MSIIETVKDAVLGKKKDEPGMGNALWRETVIKPLAQARDFMKANKKAMTAALSPEQVGLERRRAAKRKLKRKIQKLSRKRNRK